MQLSKVEECLIFDYHLQNGAEEHVAEQIEKHHLRISPEDAKERLQMSVFSNTIRSEWDNFIKSKKILMGLFFRRRYDVWEFFATEETVKRLYPDGAPEIVNVDHDVLPPKTLQIGLYLLYRTTVVIKHEDEDDEEFERRKDWHDWLNGYLNQEAIQQPQFTIRELIDELENKREIVNNHIRNLFDTLNI
tara:strand:- start:54 stop:623 length:570 start_codon:yes stop_codon:yes gene_type:complete